MADCLKCIHYNVCSALESGEDYINEDCDEYVEEANTNENKLLLIMAKGISKMCKETPCDKCMFYTQHQTEFTLFCYGLCCFDKYPNEWFDDEEE